MLLTLLMVLGTGDVLERNECFRCHAGTRVTAARSELECAGCHTRLSSGQMETLASHYTPAVWKRFKQRTAQHYVHVPPLVGLSRLRTSWLQSFLKAPYALRPHLTETMIRNTLTDADLRELAALWHTQPDAPAPARPPASRLAEARERFVAQGCPSCHLVVKAELPAQFLAPDLRITRDRMNFTAVVDYVKNPHRVNAASQMPDLARSDDEAQLLAEWVYFGDLEGPPARVEVRPPAYDPKAPVPTYEEVERRVFKAVCWHCHSDPLYAKGNGGPGMTGGFGFRGRGLSFASFNDVITGSVDDHGEPQSIFRKGKSGEPLLLEVLRARYHEEATRAGPGGPVGMPLGLPAISPEDFALVERWVRGGRPEPRGEASSGESDAPNMMAPSR